MYPDGMHALGEFKIRDWLQRHGFEHHEPQGRTQYGGLYRRNDGRRIVIKVQSGLGDVVAEGERHKFFAECKGGIINSRHAGPQSRLRRGLYEAVGHLVDHAPNGERHIAVVPRTELTERLAERMAARARKIGIEIALVDPTRRVSLEA